MRVTKNPDSTNTDKPWAVVEGDATIDTFATRAEARRYVDGGPLPPVTPEQDEHGVFTDPAKRAEAAKAEHAAVAAWVRAAKSTRGEAPSTANLDAMNAADPAFTQQLRNAGNGSTKTKAPTATHSERPEVAKGELAIELRNAKHGAKVAAAIKKLDGAKLVGGDWLIVTKADAADVALHLEQARAEVPMFDGRVLVATAVAIRAAAKLRKGETASAAGEAAMALNRELGDSWSFTVRSDGQVEFAWKTTKGDATGTARQVVSTFAPKAA